MIPLEITTLYTKALHKKGSNFVSLFVIEARFVAFVFLFITL